MQACIVALSCELDQNHKPGGSSPVAHGQSLQDEPKQHFSIRCKPTRCRIEEPRILALRQLSNNGRPAYSCTIKNTRIGGVLSAAVNSVQMTRPSPNLSVQLLIVNRSSLFFYYNVVTPSPRKSKKARAPNPPAFKSVRLQRNTTRTIRLRFPRPPL